MKVSQIMNKALVIDDVSLKEAAKIMSNKNVGSLIVMKKDKIAGIITEGDVMKNINRLGNKVSSIMSKKVITIEKNDSVENAAELMAENKIKRLPVVDNGYLEGIITVTDIIANSDSLNEDFYIE